MQVYVYVGPGMASAVSEQQVKGLVRYAESELRRQPLSEALLVRHSTVAGFVCVCVCVLVGCFFLVGGGGVFVQLEL